MKRALILLMLAALTVRAGALDLAIGAKAGAMHQSFWGEDYQDYLSSLDGSENRLHRGFTVGGFMSVGLVKVLAVQPELMLNVGGDALRYSIGLTPFNDPDSSDVLPAGYTFRNHSIQLLTGLALFLN